MKKLLLFSLLLASTTIFAQYTLIPDINFERKLISLGIDSGNPDGKVLTSNINTLTTLNVYYSSIIDLTGIQDFIALKELNCYGNHITTLDVSKNTALISISCGNNLLTELDVTKNSALESLGCFFNSLTVLDVSKNSALVFLSCYYNQLKVLNLANNIVLNKLDCSNNSIASLDLSKNTLLTELTCTSNLLTKLDVNKNKDLIYLFCGSNLLETLEVTPNTALSIISCHENQLTVLDVSKNTLLTELYCFNNSIKELDMSKNTVLTILGCSDNQLTELNVKNNNNLNFQILYSSFSNNPDLTCIQVDNKIYSDTNWNYSYLKDATASYNENCSNLSNNKVVFANVSLFPNPTKGQLYINNVTIDKVTVYNLLGVNVKTQNFDGVTTNNVLDMNSLSKGIYMVAIKSNENVVVKKVVVE